MRQVLTSVAAVALGLMTVAGAQATSGHHHQGGHHHGHSHHGSLKHVSHHHHHGSSHHRGDRGYYRSHARHNRHGYFYHGRYHSHWSYFCWDWRYGCRVFFDPGVRCYFYYCAPDDSYYPVSYCPYGRYSWGTPFASASGMTDDSDDDAPLVPPPAVRSVALTYDN